jgi:hypothetical protein
VLEECAATIREAETSSHDRYLRLFRLLKERDKSLAIAFDDLRRSTGIQRLAAMIALEVVADEELDRFSAPTRDSAIAVADLYRSSEKRRKVR